MTTRVTVAGHPIHPMLVTIPIGLWVFSFIADLVYLGTDDGRWETTAYFTLAGGLVGAIVAAVPGLLDYVGLVDQRARRIATSHLVLNLIIVAIVAVNVWLRSQPTQTMLPYLLSAVTIIALAFSGWLGGSLVHVLGVTQPGASETAGVHGRAHTHTRP